MKRIVVLILFFCSFYTYAQYSFSGQVDIERWKNDVYLSVIEDYRKFTGVYSEQIIRKVKTDDKGYFEFSGNNLNADNRIYRIHVDNCFEEQQNLNHFDGKCNDSKEILFIAKNTDTILFPFSFDDQILCSIQSSNIKSTAFIKIDSLREDMRFAFSEYRSEANRKLNNKKWFNSLQRYGKELNEPLAELYIYSFLSDRRNNFHNYYLEDLKTNTYYDELQDRLSTTYPSSLYSKQYITELNSDKFVISTNQEKSFNWTYLLYLTLLISVLINIWLLLSRKKNNSKLISKAKDQLTKQEQNILSLLLEDKSNKEIAEALFVSISTVKTHINNIYKKLDVQSREEVKSLFSR